MKHSFIDTEFAYVEAMRSLIEMPIQLDSKPDPDDEFIFSVKLNPNKTLMEN